MSKPLSRRAFLTSAGSLGAAVLVGACAAPSRSVAPHNTSTAGSLGTGPTTSLVPQSAGGSGTLVLVTLYGGNDALNTVVPTQDPLYQQLRGQLALDPATTLDVGEGFGLNPAMPHSKDLWDHGRLAIVHGVGFEGLDRSHFHCMDVWQAGDTHDLATGWVGRWMDVAATSPMDAIGIGDHLPLLLRGSRRSGAVVPAGPFALAGDARQRELFGKLSSFDGTRSPLATTAAGASNDLLEVIDAAGPVLANLGDDQGDNGYGTDGGGGLGAQLRAVAALIEAELPTRIYSVDLGGFDTHASQGPLHSGLLSQVDEAVGAFLAQMGERRVTVAIYSEFGRRVRPNASAGTDHGAAGTMLLAGSVVGGHHGDPPPLNDLDGGDLRTTVDFRAVTATLLEGVLEVEAPAVLPNAPKALALV